MNKEDFIKYLKNLKITCEKEHLEKLNTYFDLLTTWNKKTNLTRIIKEEDVYLKHYFDSLCITKTVDLKEYKSLIDIGTGAGFPGLVISIFFSNLKVTLVEANNKKCEFLKEVKENLNLTNIEIINSRAEIFARQNREKYDIATCRAVSHLSIISEICIPLLKENGLFLPLKAELSRELRESENKLTELNAKLEKVLEYTLPIENSKRTIPIIKKVGITSQKYPREYNKIIKDLKK